MSSTQRYATSPKQHQPSGVVLVDKSPIPRRHHVEGHALPQTEPDDTWHDLFDRHAAGLILYARQWCRSHADAEDAVQEGFVKCWRSRTKANDAAAYLFTCVKHAALDQARGESRRQKRETEIAQQQSPHGSEPLFVFTVDDQERVATIEQHMATLPDEQREVLVMKLWGGLTFQQIAAALDASPNTITSRYRYAIEAMRKALPLETVR